MLNGERFELTSTTIDSVETKKWVETSIVTRGRKIHVTEVSFWWSHRMIQFNVRDQYGGVRKNYEKRLHYLDRNRSVSVND